MSEAGTSRNDCRKRRYRRWLLEGLIVAVVVVILHNFQTRSVVRGPAPEFQARQLNGAMVSLREYRGQALLLQFWATWCPICRYEQDSINALAQENAVLTIAMDDLSALEMQAWLDEQGVSYPVVLDGDGRLSSLYGIKGVPSSVIIDPAGNIRFVEVGYTTEIGLRLRLWWVSL
ncbi:Membrane protein, suppressor for copper-sensitivity ScsD [hydrothermal vent metagenome]|uniref:Membrane protein, suppressor for copper-sensitivity ScsD n=1 Tax=hydrothermal vent metagenome TaxID=652676 RepID=A0A3B0YF35_9ZZZZ